MNLEDIQRMDMAAEWVLLLRQENLPDEEIAGWLRWCEADPRNQRAFDQAQKLLNLTRALQPSDFETGPVAPSPASPPRRPLLVRLRRLLFGETPTLYRAVPRFVLAVAVTGLVAAGLWSWRGATPVGDQAVVAARDPVHTALLPDGSHMELAAKTVVTVNYTPQQRALDMQDGVAYFTVAPNKQRPFIVAAGKVRVRAIGTAFNVRRAGDRVVVTVTKGTVAVFDTDQISSSSERPVQVSAGGQVVWADERHPEAVAAVDPAVALAWREGRLEYAGEPLEAVVSDVNRYSSRPVRIGSEVVGKLRFTGTVLTQSTDEWLQALPGNFPVIIVRQKDAWVIQSKG